MSGATPITSRELNEQQTSGQSTADTSSKSASNVSRGTRENKQDKAMRYLVQGRLTVTKVDGDRVMAECRGDSGEVYDLGFWNGQWYCHCPARTDCSHLSALWRVTVRPR